MKEKMKSNKGYLLVCLIVAVLSAYSQESQKESDSYKNDFKSLRIGYSKTTSIVFPYAIKSMDKGSPDILVQKAKGAENILLVKAGQKNFIQTNLTVVTSDNRLYVFILNFDEDCPDINVKADNSSVVDNGVLFSLENENQRQIEHYAKLALSKKNKIKGLKEAKYDMKLQLNGLFIHRDVIYFRILLENTSKVNYDIDQLRFFIHDQKKPKRTASQEIEIVPLMSTEKILTVADKSETTVVFALSKFTIPEKKLLTIQLIEENGERQLELNIKNTDLDNVEILNSL